MFELNLYIPMFELNLYIPMSELNLHSQVLPYDKTYLKYEFTKLMPLA